MRKCNVRKIPVHHSTLCNWFMRIAVAFLCLLLAGCAGPTGGPVGVSPPPGTATSYTPAVTATNTASSMPAATPGVSAPCLVSNDSKSILPEQWVSGYMLSGLVPAIWVTLTEDDKPVYVMENRNSLQYDSNACYSLSGSSKNKDEIETLGQALSGMILADIPSFLELHGISIDGWVKDPQIQEKVISEIAYSEAFDGEYLIINIKTESWEIYLDMIFHNENGHYTPHSVIHYYEGGSITFQKVSGQQWLLYAFCGGRGTGYTVTVAGWYNLNTKKIELRYLHSLYDSGSIAEDVNEALILQCDSPRAMEDGSENWIGIPVQIQMEAKYWPVEEGGDLIVAAPEPDTIAYKTMIRLYYDEAAHAFYILIPEEAYLLDRKFSQEWLFYTGDYMQDLLENGNAYQKRWAGAFYP